MKQIEINFEHDRQRIAKASWRFHLISPLLKEGMAGRDRVELQKEIAASAGVSCRTLTRYRKKYEKDGFEGLMPPVRPGRPAKAIDEAVLEEAVTLRREQPGRSVEDIIRILVLEGRIASGEVKRSTLQAALADAGWSKRQMRMYIKPAGGRSATRYEKRNRMELLQADIKYGPVLVDGDGNSIPTYFIGIIDDHSRKVMYGRFHDRQRDVEVLAALKCVVEAYGHFTALAIDNGRQFIAQTVMAAMAILGIKVRRARPYTPTFKSKIESYNHRLNRFIEECRLKNYTSLDALNGAYTAWQDVYNSSPHNSLGRTAPDDVFAQDERELRFITPELVDMAFRDMGTRSVQKDGTISIDGRKYIVDNLNLIGFDVHYSRPADRKDDVTVFCKGFSHCRASVLEIGEDVDFEARNRSLRRGVLETDTSRMLDAMVAEYERSHPGVSLPRETKDVPAPASFASVLQEGMS